MTGLCQSRRLGGLWPIGKSAPNYAAVSALLGIARMRRISWVASGHPQNAGVGARHVLAHDAPTSHMRSFGLDACENKHFLLTLWKCGHGIAPSQGCRDWDSRQPRKDRGRQEEWYKDLWLLQWRRLWRLWLYRAARTAVRYGSRRTRLFSKRLKSAATFTSRSWCGRTFGFVRSAPFAMRGT